MIKLTIIYSSLASVCLHSASHVRMLVEDLSTTECLVINYASCFKKASSQDKLVTDMQQLANKTGMKGCSLTRAVVLYSDIGRTIDDFYSLHSNEFDLDEYNIFCRNCADPVKAALDFFCPAPKIDAGCFLLQSLTAASCGVSLIAGGLLSSWCFLYSCCYSFQPSCLPAAPYLTTPADVFYNAIARSYYYSKPESETEQLVASKRQDSVLSPRMMHP